MVDLPNGWHSTTAVCRIAVLSSIEHLLLIQPSMVAELQLLTSSCAFGDNPCTCLLEEPGCNFGAFRV